MSIRQLLQTHFNPHRVLIGNLSRMYVMISSGKFAIVAFFAIGASESERKENDTLFAS